VSSGSEGKETQWRRGLLRARYRGCTGLHNLVGLHGCAQLAVPYLASSQGRQVGLSLTASHPCLEAFGQVATCSPWFTGENSHALVHTRAADDQGSVLELLCTEVYNVRVGKD